MNTKLFNSSTFNKLEIPKDAEDYYNDVISDCNKYGIPTGVFTSGGTVYTSYEREALDLIQLRKPLPVELQEKLLNTLSDRKAIHEKQFSTEDIEMTDSLAESILGIKLD